MIAFYQQRQNIILSYQILLGHKARSVKAGQAIFLLFEYSKQIKFFLKYCHNVFVWWISNCEQFIITIDAQLSFFLFDH